MTVTSTIIPGVFIIEPRVFPDRRGYFFESYNKREFDRLVAEVDFVQDNESRSQRGVVRGLHFQKPPFAQAKLVRCSSGRVLDIVLDLRNDSPTFGKHLAIELSDENKRQLFLPRGCAHGFAVLSDSATFQYKCDNFYSPEAEGGVSILDPSLGIDWGLSTENSILSPKDSDLPLLRDFSSPF